jgi:hypothetical protein
VADYTFIGNRYTAVYLLQARSGGKNTYIKAPFELVRYNVDADPSAPQYVVPLPETDDGQVKSQKPDVEKIYEGIFIHDGAPPFSAAGMKFSNYAR